MSSSNTPLDQRVLVLAPTSADAALCGSVLSEAEVAHSICLDIAVLTDEMAQGVATVLLTDQSIAAGDTSALTETLDRQPAWSDLPIVLLSGTGADPRLAAWALEVLGNVTILERPVRVTTLVSTLRAACRARRRQYELREFDRRKDEFLATLSHELRNPLAPLRNSLHLLHVTQEQGTNIMRIYDLMERQVDYLVRLVDDLLELARVTRGEFALRAERVQVAAVVHSAIETCEPLIAAARHQLSVSLPQQPLWVDGDPMRLAQIVGNLLNNAAKYTDPGGQIAIEVRRENRFAVISVRDTGTGISAEALPRVFEMFSRGDRARRGGEAGLGVGLGIARRLAEMHNGTLEARSAGIGKGSEFIVRIPAAADGKAKTEVDAGVESLLTPGRILVVDDNFDAADSLRLVLETLGADVRVARDGPEALELFDAFDPAVVFIDIGMPGMDGYEVARRMRARLPERRVALVALTGWGQDEDRRRAQAAGFDHHLVKPVEIARLRSLLVSLNRSAESADMK